MTRARTGPHQRRHPGVPCETSRPGCCSARSWLTAQLKISAQRDHAPIILMAAMCCLAGHSQVPHSNTRSARLTPANCAAVLLQLLQHSCDNSSPNPCGVTTQRRRARLGGGGHLKTLCPYRCTQPNHQLVVASGSQRTEAKQATALTSHNIHKQASGGCYICPSYHHPQGCTSLCKPLPSSLFQHLQTRRPLLATIVEELEEAGSWPKQTQRQHRRKPAPACTWTLQVQVPQVDMLNGHVTCAPDSLTT
jgi:hypothetical protein